MYREDLPRGPGDHDSGDRGEPIPHDQIFKTAFQLFLRDLLELLDPRLAASLDLEKPRFLEQEGFSELAGGRRSEVDLVAETQELGGTSRLVLVHVEVEGQFRESMEERLERYSMILRLKYRRPVVTVVVFLKGGQGGVTLHEVTQEVGKLEISVFRYLAFGLAGSEAEDYLRRPQPLAAALAALMRPPGGDKVWQKVECLRAIGRAKLDEARRYLLMKIVEIYLRLESEDEARFTAELERETNEEVREMVITWEEALEEREATGEARGLTLGEARGKLEATRDAILLLWRRLTGGDVAALENRLAEIEDLDRLHEILERVVDAQSLEDLGL